MLINTIEPLLHARNLLSVLHTVTHSILTVTNEEGTMTHVTPTLKIRKLSPDRLRDWLAGGEALTGGRCGVRWGWGYDLCQGLSTRPWRWSASPLPTSCPLATFSPPTPQRSPPHNQPAMLGQALHSIGYHVLQGPCMFPLWCESQW